MTESAGGVGAALSATVATADGDSRPEADEQARRGARIASLETKIEKLTAHLESAKAELAIEKGN